MQIREIVSQSLYEQGRGGAFATRGTSKHMGLRFTQPTQQGQTPRGSSASIKSSPSRAAAQRINLNPRQQRRIKNLDKWTSIGKDTASKFRKFPTNLQKQHRIAIKQLQRKIQKIKNPRNKKLAQSFAVARQTAGIATSTRLQLTAIPKMIGIYTAIQSLIDWANNPEEYTTSKDGISRVMNILKEEAIWAAIGILGFNIIGKGVVSLIKLLGRVLQKLWNKLPDIVKGITVLGTSGSGIVATPALAGSGAQE